MAPVIVFPFIVKKRFQWNSFIAIQIHQDFSAWIENIEKLIGIQYAIGVHVAKTLQ